jgi:hypothetical protein
MLAGRARALLAGLGRARREPIIESWLTAWPTDQPSRATEAASAVSVRHSLPVLEWLPRAAQAAPAFSAELCEMLSDVARDLEWRQTYTQDDVTSGTIHAAFLDRYGWCELIAPRAATRSDRFACGVLLLGPETHYPSHHHEAEELYIPLSGTAAWRQGQGNGNGEWRQQRPGTLIHHAGFEPHAMRTGADPLLALYIWRGGDLSAQARLDADGT